MATGAKRIGDDAEREAQELWRAFGFPKARRALGAGRQDDVGDMHGIDLTAIQIQRCSAATLASAIVTKVQDVEQQRKNRRVPFSAVMLKRKGARILPWIVVLSPEAFAKVLRYAIIGWRQEHNGPRSS